MAYLFSVYHIAVLCAESDIGTKSIFLKEIFVK